MFVQRHFGSAALLAAMISLPACGSDADSPDDGGGGSSAGGTGGAGGGGNGRVFDAGSDPARNQVAAGSLCARIAVIQCAGEAYCCDDPGRTVAECETGQAAACEESYIDIASADPATGYDAAAAEQAFAEFENRASQCDVGVASFVASISGLRGAMRGTIGPNATCTPDSNSVALVAAAAASCQNPETTACLPGGASGAVWNCAPRSAAGGPCLTDLNCQDGLFCDNNIGGAPELVGAVCVARKADGEACTLGQECQSLTCRDGSCIAATVQTAYCLAP